MTVVATVVGVAATLVGLLRWLRVAQREHYISGSCIQTARRWATRRPPNAPLVASAGVALLGAVALALASSHTGAAVVSVVASVLAAAFPWGMSLVGEPRLARTRRLRTLAAVATVLALAFGLFGALLLGAAAAAAATAVLVPALVDVALAVTKPFESRAAARHRSRAEARLAQVAPFVIAVTGSWGKTSTKNHIRDLLAGTVDVVASPASWNNTAGLSRTVNEHLTPSTEVLVVEMGMYGPGEIRELCSWVRPNIAVITAVGPMHLERAGSIEKIAEAKAEILERADVAVLWVDDPRIAEIADRAAVPKVWRVGHRGGQRLDVEVDVDEASGDITVLAGGEVVGTCPGATGAHAGNVGCAVAVALAHGIPAGRIAERLGGLTNPAHRATEGWSDAGLYVIDDTFNSNPSGAAASVARLARTVDGRRAVVTPGMVELGPLQATENRALAECATASGATVVVVGWTNRTDLLAGASDGSVVVVPNRAAAAEWVRQNLGRGDGVLWANDLPDHYP